MTHSMRFLISLMCLIELSLAYLSASATMRPKISVIFIFQRNKHLFENSISITFQPGLSMKHFALYSFQLQETAF